jgi:release factor glutamine methyltransferase
MNYKSLSDKFLSELSLLYPVTEAEAMFMLLVAQLFNWKRADYLLRREQLVDTEALHTILNAIDKLKKGEPLQYVLGEAHFYGLNFKVNDSVLIPRPETEELVEWIVDEVSKIDFAHQLPITVLDIGTGSGCIAIALKKNLPMVKVAALDIAKRSLAVAQENAALNEVEIDFIHADILNIHEETLGSYEVIVSNPPYITQSEKAAMHQNVTDHEPHIALFVDDHQPLIFYEAIADFALNNLKPNGLLFFEINAHLGKETVDMLTNKGLKNIQLRKDMQNNDRMICCQHTIN